MATAGKDLSAYKTSGIPKDIGLAIDRIGIVVSEWNSDITKRLLKGAVDTLVKHGVRKNRIVVRYVPGAFELALGAQQLLIRKKTNAVIAIGCVVRGETPHFDFICNATANGILEVGLKYNRPVVFCVLTDNTKKQSLDRSGGKHGNKGVEAAVTCLKMLATDFRL